MTRIDAREAVPDALAGKRLDQAAAQLFPGHSRARLQGWIKDGSLLVDGARRRPRDPVRSGEVLQLGAEVEGDERWRPHAGDLDLVFEDADLLVIDKAPGVVVHPAAGHRDDTLVNALLHRFPELSELPRAGVVHRLDKDTSGLLVVARSLTAHTALVRSLQARDVRREYEALVHGTMTGGGVVDAPMGRHPVQRKKMAVVEGGKPAVTHYRLLERFADHTLVLCRLETGRTHQIRVHMAHIRHALVGDPVYGGRARLPAGADPELVELLRGFGRQALHARRLAFRHPASDELLEFESPRPADLARLVAALREHARQAAERS